MTSPFCAFWLLFCRVKLKTVPRLGRFCEPSLCREGPWMGYYDYCYFRILILALLSNWGNPQGVCPTFGSWEGQMEEAPRMEKGQASAH